MEPYVINAIGSDGYAEISACNRRDSKEIPKRSLKILYEGGYLEIINPELLYES